MSVNKFINVYLERFLANIFFLFFIAQILSPYIGGRTVYLEFFVAVLNPYFLIWIYQKPKQKWIIILLLFIFGIGVFLKVVLIIKVIFVLVSVMFLFYAEENGVSYLKRYLKLSLVFAIAQFVLIFINPQYSYAIGPRNIATTIWGSYGTPSFTNFYTIFFMPRVSGLAREAGFLASILVCVILSYRLNKNEERERFYELLLFVGFVLSFSKMSLVIIPVLAIYALRTYVDKIPTLLIPLIFSGSLIIIWSFYADVFFDIKNETFAHRFAAYPMIMDLNVKQFLFGETNLALIDSKFARVLISLGFDSAAGFGGFIVHNGFLFLLFVFLFFYFMGCTSTGIILLLLLTINVEITTNQNFVVLAYYILFRYFSPYKLQF